MQEENRLCEALTPDDVKFLTELANELKTQDCAGTAKLVVFKVMETKASCAKRRCDPEERWRGEIPQMRDVSSPLRRRESGGRSGKSRGLYVRLYFGRR